MSTKSWYIFDEFDCFGKCDTAAEAALKAVSLTEQGLNGIEIKHLTVEEFDAYCLGGDQALRAYRNKQRAYQASLNLG